MLIMQISVQKGNIHLLDACERNLDTVYVYKMSKYISNLSKVYKSPLPTMLHRALCAPILHSNELYGQKRTGSNCIPRRYLWIRGS